MLKLHQWWTVMFFLAVFKKKNKLSVIFPVLRFEIWHKTCESLQSLWCSGLQENILPTQKKIVWNVMLISCPLLFFLSFLKFHSQLIRPFVFLYFYISIFFILLEWLWESYVHFASTNLSVYKRVGMLQYFFKWDY